MSEDEQMIKDWAVVEDFVARTRLCICGMLDDVLEYIYVTLYQYPDDKGWRKFRRSLGTDEAKFAAWVLDSWGLLEHFTQLQGGVWRSKEGEELFQAMDRLKKAEVPLLRHV